MKASLYYLVLLILLSTSCEDDELVLAPPGPRLDYYLESFEIPELGFEPRTKVQYAYTASGKVSQYTVYSYNPDSNALEEQHHFVFSYSGEQVHEIKGYLPDDDSPYIEYDYEYLADGNISVIKENNHAAGITSEANFHYDKPNETTSVVYTFSNGSAFEYEFTLADKNIVSDNVTRGSQLCSNGQYTYDSHVNPFSTLGYVDYFLTNLSENNRLTENVSHVGCSFPNLIPEAYSYEYDAKGYPTLAVVNYKSSGEPLRARKEFFYLDN